MPDMPKTHLSQPKAVKHVAPEQKRNSNSMGYNYRWQKFRESFLRKNPLCIECQKNGKVTAATDVDHIIPHRGDTALFWKPGNFAALCKSCHSAKTARGE